MKILVIAHGTRGDVQPFIALAIGLKSAGHDVTLATLPGYESYTKNTNINLVKFGFKISEVVSDSNALEISQTWNPVLRKYRRSKRSRMLYRRLLDSMKAVRNCSADLVVYNRLSPGYAIANELRVPAISTCLAPGLVPTKGLPHPSIPFKIPTSLNYASYKLMNLMTRSTHPGNRNIITPLVFQAFSKYVLPFRSATYPCEVHTTGFWYLPAELEGTPSHRLREFISNGSPPVYIGFGSNLSPNSRENGKIVTEVVRRCGVRAVVVGGYGGIQVDRTNDDIMYVDEAPFGWLFPRMSAIVHHGGSGTTALALASGRPQVILPVDYHQRFYAQRMHALGVAPEPVVNGLSAAKLACSIHKSLRTSYINSAKHLGQKVRAEAGVKKATEVIESYMRR